MAHILQKYQELTKNIRTVHQGVDRYSYVFFFYQGKGCVFFPNADGGAWNAWGISYGPVNTATTLRQCYLALGTPFPVGSHAFEQAATVSKLPKSQTSQHLAI